eukprot:CAMPEP_0198530346 /NCGR_PEP_ID=MMETSP1462-20131121/26298_1 /TAXON_ID=1333877 /ORGANISM="Brandtodinium nutriculum, Strain RCC3387" /LENGTH=603 /DNA_ID=CAMNT_0044260219 /DNA_START=25 /DNA_END=1833 /DNA_ORIENTATION=+
MVEGTELTGVAKLSATAGTAALAVASALAIVSLVMPWWQGNSEVGKLANAQTVESSITLWTFSLSVGEQTSDGAGGTTLVTTPMDMTWDQMCSMAADTADGAPGACMNVNAIRAFAILAALMGLPGAAALWQARTFSPLLLVVGGLLGILTSGFSFFGVLMGMAASTSGLSGLGVLLLLGGAMVAALGVAAAFYGSGVAMPVDPPPAPKRTTRQQRVKEQFEKDAETGKELASRNPPKRRDSGDILGVDGSESSEPERKPPEMLKRVLFWSQEHGGDADSEGIPTSMLENAFREIDADGSGAIEIDELVEALQLCGLAVSYEATINIMKEVDKDLSGDIDIIEFVGFFRQLEELDRFQAKSAQRAQFVQCLCNFCFIAHIIIVSAILMSFINMNSEDDPDSYLIMQNMLMGFSLVLGILLICVICMPAARLTLGGSIKAWERQWHEELRKRITKPGGDDEESKGARNAAWGTSANAAEGLTELTVNSAMFGMSYRLSKQAVYLGDAHQRAQQEVLADANDPRKARQARAAAEGRALSKVSRASGASGVLTSKSGAFERYDPDQYRAAAMAAMQNAPPTSFSPMQVLDLDMQRQEPQMPGVMEL